MRKGTSNILDYLAIVFGAIVIFSMLCAFQKFYRDSKTLDTINTGNMILLTSESGANIHATEYVDTETGVHYIMWYDPALDASAITVRFGGTGEPIKEGD